MTDYPPMKAPRKVATLGKYKLARFDNGRWDFGNGMRGTEDTNLLRAVWRYWRLRYVKTTPQ